MSKTPTDTLGYKAQQADHYYDEAAAICGFIGIPVPPPSVPLWAPSKCWKIARRMGCGYDMRGLPIRYGGVTCPECGRFYRCDVARPAP